MAVRGGFSSALITAHRRWWKDVLMLWRRCVVFGLSFDYIPNYSASKQLNEAWLSRADQRRRFAFYALRRSHFVLAHVGGRERDVWWRWGGFTRHRSLPWLQGSIVSQWHHHQAHPDESMMSWFECRLVRPRVRVCARGGEKAGVEEERFSQT